VTSFKNKGAGWVTPRIPLGDPMGVTYNSRKTLINSLKKSSPDSRGARWPERCVSDCFYANESGIQEACYQSAIRPSERDRCNWIKFFVSERTC
jgi:hypothetical protein